MTMATAWTSDDAFPLNAGEWLDTDIDGIGNNAERMTTATEWPM